MRRKKRVFVAALAAAVLVCTCPVHAEEGLSLFGDFGQESNQFTVPQGFGESVGDVVALDDLSISVNVTDYRAIRQSDGFVYVYTQEDGSMPYVIIGRYDAASDDFADAFTAYMSGVYADLRVAEEAAPVSISGNAFSRIVYEYTVSGYTVRDTRLFTAWNGFTFMFGKKEVPVLDLLVESGCLEQIAGSFAPLAGGDGDYALHVDTNRSVEGSASEPVADLGGLGDDILSAGSDGTDTGGSEVGSGGEDVPGADVDGSITFDESVADYTGTWVRFSDGFQLYLPVDWMEYALTEEDKEAGALYLAYDADKEGTPYVEVDWTEGSAYNSLDDILMELDAAGYVIDGKISMNGIPCVSYTSPESNVCGLMFFHPYDRNYIIAIVAGSYSYDVDTLAAILCSLSPA